MRTRPAEIVFATAFALVALVAIVTGGCKRCRPSIDGSRLDIRMAEADSPQDIENMIRASLAYKYAHEDMKDCCTIHQLTNGPAHWVFAKAYNAPRGLSMFNLYCYEQEKSGNWLLRAYVPVNAHDLTNSYSWELRFQTTDNHIDVEFRGVTIFTTPPRRR